MNPKMAVILFRKSLAEEDEFEIAKEYFDVYELRNSLPPKSTVIARYSALPYYKELEDEVKHIGGSLVNSYAQHRFIADCTQYAEVLGDLTIPVYEEWGNLPEGSYVVKGKTNSRKHQWNSRMFAKSLKDVPRIVNSLLDDALIMDQGVIVRPYIRLKTFGQAINGLPITNEWRAFVFNKKLMALGYYWASYPEYQPVGLQDINALILIEKVIEKIDIPFYVIDIAEKAEGGWIVIELNDGQMSGLSTISPRHLYHNLHNELCRMRTNDGTL